MVVRESDSRVARGKVTIKTVAIDAGVSVAAVSKVLRDAYGVSAQMREKVQGSIDRLGYRPSGPARGLRGRTYTIGVLLIELRNAFLPDVIDGVNRALEPSSYRAMIGVGRGEAQLESSLVESMIDYRMDGLILVAPRLPSEVLEGFAAQVPIVTIGSYHQDAQNYDTVNTNDQVGARLAVAALVGHGHRDIAMLSLGGESSKESSIVRQREIGYRHAMTEAGLVDRIRIAEIPPNSPEREAAITNVLSSPNRPRAVFVWSDLDAVLVLAAAQELGLSVPDDVAVVGFDNSSVAQLPMIGLSSIDQPGFELGERATQLLLSRIQGRGTPVHFGTEPRFVRRRSA